MRTKIPDRTATEVLRAVDRRCCLCPVRAGLPPQCRGQIHHLDENPVHNQIENLVYLCVTHHEEVGTIGPTTRRIPPELISEQRDELVRLVAARRISEGVQRSDSVPASLYAAALDALVVMDVRKLSFRAGDDWKSNDNVLEEILAYPEHIGLAAKAQILEYVANLARLSYRQMPSSTAGLIRSVTLTTADLDFPDVQGRKKADKAQMVLREMAAGIGRSLVYEGSLRLHDLRVVEAGAEILWRLLSIAVASRRKALERLVLQAFAAGFDGASRGKQAVAAELLVAFRDHGLKAGSDYPPLSRALIFKMAGPT